MKKLLPVFMPFILIGTLVFILAASPQHSADTTTNKELPSQEQPYVTDPLNNEDLLLPDRNPSPPKAIVVEEDEESPPSYSSSQYPFVNQLYKWRNKGAWVYKYRISFNSDGSVTQNFLPNDRGNNLLWWPNNRYAAVLSDGSGWTIDVTFDTRYSKFTARRRDSNSVYYGKKDR